MSEEDVFGPPQWELDSVMKTSVTKKFKVKEPHNEPQLLKSEMEAYRRDILDKNAHIQKLTEKHEEYKLACNAIHNLILEFEKITRHKFFTKDQRAKNILITHFDYVKLIKESVSYILQRNDLLEEKFTQDFSKIAETSSDKLISIRNEFIKVRKKKEEWENLTKKMRRYYQINERERKSLQQIVNSLGQEKAEIDQSTQQAVSSFNIKMDKLQEERRSYQQQRKDNEKKYTRIINKKIPELKLVQRKKQKNDTTIEDSLLQKAIQELSKRYFMESGLYDKTRTEYEYILSEVQRGKDHINRHRKALSNQEIEKAQKVNQDLKEYIDKERIEDKIKYDSQVKKNKELERTIKEHLEEQQMLKQYLSQLEKKIAIQASKLPSLQTAASATNPRYEDSSRTFQNQIQTTIKLGSRHRNDDIEMKLIKRAMSTISRKKQVSKMLNMPSKY